MYAYLPKIFVEVKKKLTPKFLHKIRLFHVIFQFFFRCDPPPLFFFLLLYETINVCLFVCKVLQSLHYYLFLLRYNLIAPKLCINLYICCCTCIHYALAFEVSRLKMDSFHHCFTPNGSPYNNMSLVYIHKILPYLKCK